MQRSGRPAAGAIVLTDAATSSLSVIGTSNAAAAAHQAPQGSNTPSRREALFGALGAGLGVGLTTAFFKSEEQLWVGWAGLGGADDICVGT
jgi:predicted lipid-binding transport protein (Tim44 family)